MPGMCRITVTHFDTYQPVLPCRNVLCYSSKLTDNTENGQLNSPLPSAPSGQQNIWGSSLACSWTWLMENNFGRVIMIRNKCNLIWCYSSGQQLQNERRLSRYSGLLTFRTISFTFVRHVWTYRYCCSNISAVLCEHYCCIVDTVMWTLL